MKIIPLLFIVFLVQGCVALSNLGKSKPKLDQLQLQESIQRFYSRFTERVIEGVGANSRLRETQLETLLRQYLLYDSEALKIATAPYPEVNLLDMLVFIKLNKAVVRRYWIPHVFGKDAEGLLDAFYKSELDINEIALQIMDRKQLIAINQGIEKWLRENPDSKRVEKIRIADFSKLAKANSDEGFSFSISQIFVDTKSAVKAVDQVALVGNRALFLAQHMPFILRLQARIGSQEILSDSLRTLQGAPERIDETVHTITPLIHGLVSLAREMDTLVKDFKTLMPKKKVPGKFNKTLAQIDSIVEKSSGLVEGVSKITPDNFQKNYREFVFLTATTIFAVAAAISLVWWTGYYITKRLLNSSVKKEIT